MEEFNIDEFKKTARVFRAPARINLIGEHIDYNGGFVLPACVNLYIKAYAKKRNDKKLRLLSRGYKAIIETDLDHLSYNPRFKWAEYPIGTFYIMVNSGYKIDFGLDIYFESDIPSGSGLSSSAAILDVTGLLISNIYNLNLSKLDIVKIAKRVENEYCCLKSGIMDQAIIALGKKNNALLLNCDNLQYAYKNMILDDYIFVILKTNKPRKLTESKYNERVSECERALKILKNNYNINTLCDLNVLELDKIKELLNDDILFRRVKHVITENKRVIDFSFALERGDIKLIAKLLDESHESLNSDYEVTGSHLNEIVKAAKKAGAIGARMTGAGFGGCAIALINKNLLDFKDKISKYYFEKMGIRPDIYYVDIVDGIEEI